ncbi:nucleobase:cation symporter-2 family protein [Delftia tsuruhatensis]|uniref:nucleobase:cation symporter-2 family protein n=1 Tax=Delftia tsuruhatensis TaxID=180282 RepID=UPI0020903D2C|nr:nucleobase:cation symporter-2 family protein [Delftia tsuruhatensis]MCO5337263.1 purine permease [Delftia tsuruhatensis]MCR4545988.1 purine permease [Delftia tsuruhatensis]
MEKSSGNAPALGADIRPEDEQLGLTANTLYGLQHVLTMYGGIVAVPLVMANAAGMSAADTGLLITACLFMGGLATLLQTLGIPFFGSRLPLVQGVSFSGVATMVSILHTGGGMQGVLGAVLFASVFGLIIAPIFSKLTRFFPPLVNGCVITIIGLSLMPVAAHWAMGGNPQAADYGSMGNIGLAGLSLVIVLALSKLGNAMISRLSILLAIVIGTAVAAMIGKSDFSEVGSGAWFAVPMPLHFGWPTFSLGATLSMSIVILVTLVETSADILAVGDIVGTRVDSRRLADGLRADMLSSVVAPFFGSFTQSAFAQNVGLVAVTGIKSRYVVAFSGLILIAFGLLPIMGRIVACVPPSVLGGAGLVLFGTVAASGIRTLAKVDYHNNMNLIIVAASIGMGVLPMVKPDFYHHFPDWFATMFHSGISSTAVTVLLLNLVFNHFKQGNPEEPSVFGAGSERVLSEAVLSALADGDRVVDGKLYDREGKQVATVSAPASAMH